MGLDADLSVSKRKTSMLLYTIEEALGNYIKDNKNSILCSDSGFSEIKISDALEKAYLDDVFQLAILATKGTSDEELVKRLYKLSHDLVLFEIRNAIAHPNRQFFDCYWYRVATIASDPIFEKLGIKDVKSALYSAESGSIEDPPEGWENQYAWSISNNLPSKTESDITGLVGRNKELSDLKVKLANPRINSLAIVAPGGFGKTALVLDLLKEIVSTTSSTEWVDGVVYVTMKMEELTTSGTIGIKSFCESSELELFIGENIGLIFDDDDVSSLDEAVEKYTDKKLVICIDNLETVLRDNPEVFNTVTEKLPINWKILVTSRVSITNAFIYTLKELSEKSAAHLARLYNKNKGGDELPNENYTVIAHDCFCNPLAIRLTLDLVISGHEIPKSLNTARSSISEFSYKNLIDSLSELSIKILELIYIKPGSNRKSMCELLDISADEAAEGLFELSRTSLIRRNSLSSEVETYEVNNSVEELLASNARNMDVRAKLQESISRQKTIIQDIDIKQRQSNLPLWHSDYISPDIDDGLKILLKKKVKLSKNKFRDKALLSNTYSQFKEAEELYGSYSCFHLGFAKILSSMRLNEQAESHYLKAIELSSSNDEHVSKYALARFYLDSKHPEKASNIYTDLYKNIGGYLKFGDYNLFCASVYEGYLMAQLYTGGYQKVIDETKTWKDSTHFRGLLGTYRASAFKRKMESVVNSDHKTTVSCLKSATRIMNDVLTNEGYAHSFCVQAYHIIEEFIYCFSREIYSKNYPDLTVEFLNFCDKHLLDVIDGHRRLDRGNASTCVANLMKIDAPENPFNKKFRWHSYGNPLITSGIDIDEIPKGAILVHIDRFARNEAGNRLSYLFAIDNKENKYFIHFKTIDNGEWRDWLNLRDGYALAVDGYDRKPGKDAYVAIHTYMVNT